MRRKLAWTQFRAVVLKETRQTVRDKRVMVLLVGAPVLQLFVLGFSVNFDVREVPTVVVDHDRTSFSRARIQALDAGDVLRVVEVAPDERAAQEALDDGRAAVGLVLPRGLQHAASRDGGQVQLLVDGSDPVRSTVATDAAARYFAKVSRELSEEQQLFARSAAAISAASTTQSATQPPAGRITMVTRALYNPTLATAVYVVPGIAAMILLIVTTITMAMGLAREREAGTLEQLSVTPIGSGVLMAGKITPFLVAGILDVGLTLAVGAWVFDVPLRGSFLVIGAATLLYIMSTLGAGLLIATLSRTQQQAFLGGFLFMLPAVLLSGVLTPIHSMPDWLRPVTYLNPLRFFVEILRGVLLKAAGAAELWPQMLTLAVFGVGVMTIATLRFHKTAA